MTISPFRRAWHLWVPRPVPWVLVTLVAVFAGLFIYRNYIAVTEARRIEHLFGRAARAVEAESIIRLGDVLALNYLDASGADRAMVLGQAQRFFQEAKDLRVRIARVIHEAPDISPGTTEARAIVIVKVEGKQDGEAFSGIGGSGADAFLVGLRKRNRQWQVVSSKYLTGKTPDELMAQAQWKEPGT